jgi:3-isopropylmalate dehydrogenase
MSDAKIVVLAGDGIGPEIVRSARQVLDQFGSWDYDERLIGGASIDADGVALTDGVLDACRACDAVLLGAVGGPKWDTTDPEAPRPEQGLLGLRKGMGLFANLRPVRPIEALYDASPLKSELIEGVDMLVIRELTGGIYFGEKTRERLDGGERASDLCAYTTQEIERVVRVAAALARKRRGKLTSVDKANVLETSRMWRRGVTEVAAG